jgi:PHD/YefM family antitoxin component YafN of YafNO toxin-antitoxin module
MKKLIFLIFSLCCISYAMAQDNRSSQRMPAPERAKLAVEKMAPLDLTPENKASALVIMTTFYESAEKAIREMRQSGNVDRESLMATRKKLASERDAELKKIFTEQQMEKWLKEIEPTLRPQRGS